tara:strand:- start:580 stop:921 length:342 start_codon:yes stop_codon:yes gene_type:complete
MKKIYKRLFLLLFLGIFSQSCQSVTDGLTLKKKDNSKQFLIEQKQPLVMPPDFDKLPEPGTINTTVQKKESKDKKINLEELIKSTKNAKSSSLENNNLSQEIKKKINKKLVDQ